MSKAQSRPAASADPAAPGEWQPVPTMLIGGQDGVQAYETVKARMIRAGCDVRWTVGGGRAGAGRYPTVPADCKLVVVLRRWVRGFSMADFRGMVPAEVSVMYADHRWADLGPRLADAGVRPDPALPVYVGAPPLGQPGPTALASWPSDQLGTVPPADPIPPPCPGASSVPPSAPESIVTDTDTDTDTAALQTALFDLVVLMRESGIDAVTVDRHGHVEYDRTVVTHHALDLDLD